jgi:hypothetical protein
MTGYDKKSLTLVSSESCHVTAEIDISGMGDWHPYRIFELKPGETVSYEFPDAFQAYWIRFVSDADTTLTAHLNYR